MNVQTGLPALYSPTLPLLIAGLGGTALVRLAHGVTRVFDRRWVDRYGARSWEGLSDVEVTAAQLT